MTRRRLLAIVGVVALAMVAIGAVLLWPRGADPVTNEQALARFRAQKGQATTQPSTGVVDATSSSITTPESPVLPDEGVYTFDAEGSEDVKLGPLPAEHRPLAAQVTMALVHGDDPSCFTTTLNLFTQHVDDTTFCTSSNGLVRLTEQAKHQKIGGLEPTATLACDPSVIVDPSSDQTELACTISLEGGPVKVNSELTGTSRTSAEPVTVEGKSIAATRVELTFEVSGGLSGTWTERIWLAEDNRLPVRIERNLNLAGPATLQESFSLTLTSLTPKR